MTRPRPLRLALAALVLLCAAVAAPAHETTRSYLSIVRDGSAVTARLSIAFRDLEPLVWIDADLDGAITWAEAQTQAEPVLALARTGITLEAGGPCPMQPRIEGAAQLAGLAFLDLTLTGECPSATGPLTVSATLLSTIDPSHRLFLSLLDGGATATAVLPADGMPLALSVDGAERTPLVLRYAVTGATHIAGGWDHALYVLVLLLPVLSAAPGLRGLAAHVLAPVSGFTLGHAASLTVATLGLALPQPEVVEKAILVTILLTAIDNLWPFLPGPRALVAAAFGLIHGFGFAAALGGLPLGGGDLALALLGFNLGVEAAQLVAVAAVLPALSALRAPRSLLVAGSAGAILLVGLLLVPGTRLT